MPVLQDHARAPRPRPTRSVWPLLRVAALSMTMTTRLSLGRIDRARSDAFIDEYWRRIFALGNARLEVAGRERFDGRACVVMSNHRSLLDIPALMGAVPPSLRMVMKEELLRVPIWGPNCVRAGFIPIARGDRERALAQLEIAKQRMAEGIHVWIAPEGTRSRTGALLPFKKGGFHLARDLAAPIVPARIEGTDHVIPPDSLLVTSDQTVRVSFGAPIETAGRDVADVMADVRAALDVGAGTPGDGC